MFLKKLKKIFDLTEQEALDLIKQVSGIMVQYNLKKISIGGLEIERDTNALPADKQQEN